MSNEYAVHICDKCRAPTYPGDHYYDVLGNILCDDCIKDCGEYAEEPDWDAVRYDDERGDRYDA